MRVLSTVNRVCYVVCVLSIVLGSVFAFVGIWGYADHDSAWRVIGSSFVSFTACTLLVAVNSVVGTRASINREPPPCDEAA